MTNELKAAADELKALRESTGLSVLAAAKLCSFSHVAWLHWESGRRRITAPNLSWIRNRLAELKDDDQQPV